MLLLQGAAVRVACPLWSQLAGAAAGCCFKVLQLKWCVRFGVYAAMARPAKRPWAGPEWAGPEYIDYEENQDLNAHL